jgi:hypothetical protein
LLIGGLGSAVAGLAGLAWYRMLPVDARRASEGITGRPAPVALPESDVVVRLPESEPLRGASPDP